MAQLKNRYISKIIIDDVLNHDKDLPYVDLSRGNIFVSLEEALDIANSYFDDANIHTLSTHEDRVFFTKYLKLDEECKLQMRRILNTFIIVKKD